MSTIYPFDPTGSASTNKITNENQVLSPGQYRDFHFLVPNAAPFFADSMVLKRQGQSQPLQEGVDFYFSHKFVAASYSTGKRIYGSITFYDESLTGAAIMTYQSVGGEWTLDDAKILEILGDNAYNPRTTSWDEIADLPKEFPPINHDFSTDDLVNFNDLVDVLRGDLIQAIQQREQGFLDHTSKANPHNITKAKIDLGNVENYPVANDAISIAASSEHHYATPRSLYVYVDRATSANARKLENKTLTEILNDIDKETVGLGVVENFPPASKLQAELGTPNNLYMTPLRTKQLIDKMLGPFVDDALDNYEPDVDADFVGLGNVENYPIASDSIAKAGQSTEHYLTPSSLPAYVDHATSANANKLQGKTITQIVDGLTKGDVGLDNVENYTPANRAEAEAGTANNRYMTPLRVLQSINENVDKELVGLDLVENYPPASNAIARAGQSTEHYITPAALDYFMDYATASDSQKLGGKTLSEITSDFNAAAAGLDKIKNYGLATLSEARAGTIHTKYMTPLRVADYVSNLLGSSGGIATLGSNSKLTPSQLPNIDAAYVGLNKVQNLGLANKSQAEAGSSNGVYMTPQRVAEYINKRKGHNNGLATLNSNGKLTSSQMPSTGAGTVGLGNVENYPIANKAEAEAGTASNRYMTPQRVAQHVDERRGKTGGLAPLNSSGKLPKSYLQSLSKSDVGLSSVEDYGIASAAQARAGTTNSKYATPRRVADYVNNQTGNANGIATLDSNAKLTSSQLPNISKSDVGLGNVKNYGVATATEAQNGLVMDKFLTPGGARYYVGAQKGKSDGLASLNGGKLLDTQVPNNIIKDDDWAQSNKGGIVKVRRDGNTLYITTDGSNA